LLCISSLGCNNTIDRENEISIPNSASNYIGRNVQETLNQLEFLGFTNINIIGLEEVDFENYSSDIIIREISINGNASFKEKAWFPIDAEIIITRIIEIELSSSSIDLKGNSYDDVVSILIDLGFINIWTEGMGNLSTGFIRRDGIVRDISINGVKSFTTGTYFPIDAEIVISHNSFNENRLNAIEERERRLLHEQEVHERNELLQSSLRQEAQIVDYIDFYFNFNPDIHVGRWIQITGVVNKEKFSSLRNICFTEGLGDSQVTIKDDDDMIWDIYSNGDIITVTGRVDDGPNRSGTFRTTGMTISHAEARLATDEEIAQIEVYAIVFEESVRQAEETARLQAEEAERAAQQAERDYKNSAKTISYDNLMRNPDDYVGEIIKVTIRITQIFDSSGLLGGLYERGFAGMQGRNLWVIQYDLPDDSPRILVGDTVTFYGVYNGVKERRETDRTLVYLPHMTASYHS